jgi:vesicle coat complex subunit
MRPSQPSRVPQLRDWKRLKRLLSHLCEVSDPYSSTVLSTNIRLPALILGGDFYTGSVLASTLTKLILRFSQVSKDVKRVNSLRAEAMLIMTSVIRVGQSKFSAVPIDEDSQERIMNCVQTLAQLQTPTAVNKIFLKDTKAAYAKMVATEEVRLRN